MLDLISFHNVAISECPLPTYLLPLLDKESQDYTSSHMPKMQWTFVFS